MIGENISSFLAPDIEQIRRSIRDIDDSYNNEWDILAELLQNSVDAIRETERARGKITIEVDAREHAIRVVDDGIGIDPDLLRPLLRPFSTKKGGDDRTIGEKGVGLTFAIFASDYFEIRTGTPTKSASGRIVGARAWKFADDETDLHLQTENHPEQHVGTDIRLQGIDAPELFELTANQLSFVLRTRTAVGNTLSIFSEDVDIETTLSHIDRDGIRTDLQVPFKYWLPTEGLAANDKIDLATFRNWVSEGDRSDAEKRRKLRDKVIFSKGQKVHGNNRTLQYFACYVPQRKAWHQLSVRNGLGTADEVQDEGWLDLHWYAIFQAGIFSSVKGMPTGIRIDSPHTGWAGYWGNLFILIEDSALKFDIGRKSIHGRIAGIHQQHARSIFNDFRNLITKYVAGDISQGQASWDRDEIFDEVQSLVDNGFDCIRFQKTPFDQEASVAAIFYEAIGAELLTGITPLISGYREKYDLYAKWGKRKVVLEFKAKLGNITKDFNDAQKYFDEIDAIVCWEVTDSDRAKLGGMGIEVEPIVPSVFSDETDQTLPNATHVMSLGGARPVFVIDLKAHLAKAC